MARPRGQFMHFRFIIEIVSPFCDMFPRLRAFLYLSILAFLNLFKWITVFLLEIIAFDTLCVKFIDHFVHLRNLNACSIHILLFLLLLDELEIIS